MRGVYKRKSYKMLCAICGKEIATTGIHSHLKHKHNMTTKEYIEKFGGNYRQSEISAEKNRQSADQLFTCSLCNDEVKYTERALSYHLRIAHSLDKNEYVIKYLCNGIPPTCKCGCGKQTKILSCAYPYASEYISGHNKSTLGFNFSNESKKKMHESAMKRINGFVELDQKLPMHSRKGILLRVYKTFNEYKEWLKFRNISIISDQSVVEDDSKEIIFKCDITGKEFAQKNLNAKSPHISHIRSLQQLNLTEFVKSIYNGEIVEDSRKILPSGKEIDIYLPDKKIGIEFNGNYYHSELSGGKSSTYHLDKTNEAESVGVHLIQIFSDEWESKQSIVKEKLRAILGASESKRIIYARKCIIKEIIEASVKDKFLEENHIQGKDKAKIKLGMYCNDELVACFTLSLPNVAKGGGSGFHELSRYCTLSGTKVIGGCAKFIAHIKRNYPDVKEIITYADRRWTYKPNNIYVTSGFAYIKDTKPNYFYTYNYKTRLYRFNFTKQKLINMGEDKTKSEWEIMQDLGYDRIWDSGHLKYKYTLQNV